MELKVDERIAGLHAIKEEIVDQAGWQATLGWKRRYRDKSYCLQWDFLRALWRRWKAIIRMGITPEIVRYEVAMLRPALREFFLSLYYCWFSPRRPGYEMAGWRKMMRYSYCGYSKRRVAVLTAQ